MYRIARLWLVFATLMVALILGAAAALVWWVDPYFHYRAPQTGRFHYVLDNQRFQNDGIVKHFDYQALVTGSSMSENFKASDVERLWGLNAVKVPFSGASYRELAQLVLTAVRANPKLELIIVGLDFNKLIMDPNWMRNDLGSFPDYLYDENPWNDVRYLLNRDAVWKSLKALSPWTTPGITSFDDYSCWHTPKTRYGADAVLRGLPVDAKSVRVPVDAKSVRVEKGTKSSSSDAEGIPRLQADAEGIPRLRSEGAPRLQDSPLVAANIRENLEPIMSCGRKVLFFITPYSAARMYCWIREGRFEQQLQAERQLAESVFRHPNVRLFSFNDRVDVTGNLDNYRDLDHYGPWINSRILEWMRAGEGGLMPENLPSRIDAERKAYRTFDFQHMFAERKGKR